MKERGKNDKREAELGKGGGMNEREKEGCSAGTMEMLSGGEGHLSLSLFLSLWWKSRCFFFLYLVLRLFCCF